EMLVALSKLEQAISVGEVPVTVGVHVLQRAADEHVAFPDVRCRDGKADDPMHARRNAPFDDAAKISGQILVTNYPVVLRRFAVDDEVRQGTRVWHSARFERWTGVRETKGRWLLRSSAGDGTEQSDDGGTAAGSEGHGNSHGGSEASQRPKG